ncbi:hypothetical protein AV274_5704 [Blastocystis sp. ATCC 50177/Nand II]|uniref:Uncharacterized protein n=1 Tax=Blastocystis sp. subtype 1 (strain ATCC 50177 / NandII) TaxID=478820 RepID=A0A196S942_BLAHN|nr:hypothetical protein AV274_5704 [Blastocystis sp. ATCC 50177/Nand II]
MVNKENNPYERIFGNYSPVCGNRIVFNVSGEKSVYWCFIAMTVPLLLLLTCTFRSLCKYTHISLVIILTLINLLAVFFFLRTWFTEPGIIPKSLSQRKLSLPPPNETQRMVSGLMVSVRNNRPQYITKALDKVVAQTPEMAQTPERPLSSFSPIFMWIGISVRNMFIQSNVLESSRIFQNE